MFKLGMMFKVFDYHIAAYRLNKLIYKMHNKFEEVTW